MNIKAWINGTEYTSQVEFALQFTDVIDGGQDNGGFTLRNNVKTPFPQFSQVEIKIDNTSFFWYISEDKVVQKSPASLYIHNISLIERVKILEGYYLANITFTQPMQRDLALPSEIYTYKSAIERALAITPFRIGGSGSYPKFQLDSFNTSLINKLESIEFPESFPTSKNLYEFMLNVGRLLGAVPYMVGWNVISFWFIDDANNEILAPNYDNFYSEKLIDQYCTNIDTTLNNVITENDEEQGAIVVPSPTGYMSTRADGIEFVKNGDNDYLALPYPIHSIKKVICYGFIKVVGWNYEIKESYTIYEGIRAVDITKWVIEKTQYDILPDKQKANYLYFQYGSTQISGMLYSYEKIFGIESARAILFVLNAALKEEYGAGAELTVAELNDNSYQYLYRVEYIPSVQSLRCQIERKQDSTFRTQFSFAANQTDSSVSCKYAGRWYQQHIERIGKEARKYVATITDYLTELPQVGSYFVDNGDRFYLFKLNCQIVNPNKALLETYWSKDFTAISERIGLNALPRFTEITQDTVIRADVYKEHCIVSNAYQQSNSVFYNYTTFGKTAGMRSAIWASPKVEFIPSGRSQCNFAYVRTYFDTTGIQATNTPLLLPVSSIAIGNALSFSVLFKDNYSAGVQIRDIDSSKQACYDVRYTGINSLGGSFGRLTTIRLDYISDTEAGALNTFAKAQKLPEIVISDYATNRLWSLDGLDYRKDTREVPSINYMLCFEGQGSIVLGEAFTQRNPLVATDNARYITYADMQRVAYNFTSHKWEANGSGTYLRYKGAVMPDLPSLRFNRVGSGWIQSNTGTHLRISKQLRLVYLKELISNTHTGPLAFDNITSIALNKLNATEDVPMWWFGSNIDTPPTFNTTYKAWAILDEHDSLVIGNNAQNFNPVYFNFRKEKTYENNI